jgi:hypothetical protein
LPLIAVSGSTGQALVVTGAGDPERLAVYARKVLRQTARLVVPAAVAMALAAPYVLRLFGREYADHAATTLSLLALSAIPNVITTLYVSIYRVQRRMRAVVTVLAGLGAAGCDGDCGRRARLARVPEHRRDRPASRGFCRRGTGGREGVRSCRGLRSRDNVALAASP